MSDDTPKYPDIEVELVGKDGNAFAIIGRVKNALKAKGVPSETVREFVKEAMGGDYDNVLRTAMRWVNVT